MSIFKHPSLLFTSCRLDIFTIAQRARRSSNWLRLYSLRASQQQIKCTITTTWAQFSPTGTLWLWDCAIPSSHFSRVFQRTRTWKKRPVLTETRDHCPTTECRRPHGEPLQRHTAENIIRQSLLALFCLYEKNWKLLSATYLSQEELFSQIFIVWVTRYNM